MTAWVNGALVPVDDAHVSVLDHGITVGDGVFETMRVYRGVPFAWTRHIARLHASADGIGLALPGDDELRAAVDEVMAANNCIDARLRVTVTGGVAPPGSGRAEGPPTVFVLAFPIDPPAPSATIVVAPWTLNENGALAGLKTISYGANVRALAYARERGAAEALFANTLGNVCEATGSNIFCVIDDELVTPPPSSGCLLGVTRALILELAAEHDVPFAEADIPLDALRDVQEAFLSSSTREVQPITKIDERTLTQPNGPTTQKLAAAFQDLVSRDLDP
jgi:branched-chain amino acid aminotransferase